MYVVLWGLLEQGGDGMTAWQLQRTPYESEIDIVSDGRTIATVEAGEDKEEIAQMIVSAPDMLEALEEVVAITENLQVCPFCGAVKGVQSHRPDCLSHEINATIRKARGEE